MKVRDRCFVLTGAAGGFGLALAEALRSRGARVVAVDRHPIENGMQADIGDREANLALPARIETEFGPVDGLINNAAISLNGPLDECRVEHIEHVLRVNLLAAVVLTHGLLPRLRQRPQALIANVLSGFAFAGFPGKTAYCASKAGLLGFTRALQTELAGTSVHTMLVIPPAMDTGLARTQYCMDTAKREREAEFLAARGLPVGRVADRVVDSIEQGRRVVRYGAMSRALEWGSRWVPELLHRVIARRRDRLGF